MASANQTVIDTAGPSFTDASGNVWTITTGAQVALNGTTQTTTSSVTKLAYVNGVVWAENTSSNWYSYPGGTGYWTGPAASPLVASPSNTVVTTVGPTIVDAGGNSWTITAGAQMAVDSVAVAVTNAVIELAYVNGVVWQLNTSNNWYAVTSITLPSTVGYSAATTTSPLSGLTIATPGQQISNIGFTVTGTIIGYAAAPTLYYRDDAGAWGPLPASAVVSATAFSFTNPGLAAGSHTISVEDSNNTAIVVSSGSFAVVSGTTPIITVAAPSLPATSDPFTLSGTLANYAVTPALTYSDNGSAPVSLPNATITTSSFTFTHPGRAAGPCTTVISDGTNQGEVSYSVTAIVGGASANLTTDPPAAFLTDGADNRWTIATGARVAVNGLVDTTSTGAVELAWVTNTVWYLNTSGLWFGKTSPTGTWAPAAGTTVNPLSDLPTLAINPIASPAPNTAFPVTGSLGNYSLAPTLTYSDNGGPAYAFPSGSTVGTTAFSFTHPGMVSGSDTMTVSDGTYTSAPASYSVFTPGFISLPAIPGLSTTITGLLPSTNYIIQVYATNSGGQGPISSQVAATTSASAAVLPSAPTGLTSSSVAQTTVTLSWTAPATGTTPFTYATRWSLHGNNSWTAGPTGSTTTAQVTGLTANTSYDFEVLASNGAGNGPESSIYTVSTLSSAPAAVTWSTTAYFGSVTWSNGNLTVTTGGSTTPGAQRACVLSTTAVGTGNVSFEVTLADLTVNSSIGLVNSAYPLTDVLGSDTSSTGFFMGTGSHPAQTIYYNGSATLAQPSGNVPSADVNGAVFTFCVNFTLGEWWVTGPAMQTAYGAAAWNDSATASPATGVGGIPLGVSGALSVAFAAGEGGAVAVFNPGSSTFYRASEIPSTYPAWNGTAITVVVPGQVTGLTAGAPTTSTVGLTWTAPSTGSLPFTYYILQSPHGSGTWSQVGTSATASFAVTGLASSTSYDFEVYAANAAGNGANSTLVTVTTTSSVLVPGAPFALSAGTPTTTTVPLTWSPPSSGSTPTGYQVQYKLTTSGTWINFGTTVPESSAAKRNWFDNPGETGSFWVQPFQNSANWITSGALITALRNGAGSSPSAAINLPGNYSAPFYRGKSTDPLVEVTDGTLSKNIRIPLGAVIETPTSAVDQSIGGLDESQPYLVWSISGATCNTGPVAASGSVITGTYGFCLMDGSGLLMVDAVTGNAGNANSFGGITSYDLAQFAANPAYFPQHMLAYSLDPNYQCSGAGPIWPLQLVDTSSANTGPIPQGCTIGIPASTPIPAGLSAAQLFWFNMLQQFGAFFYNVAASGYTTFFIYDDTLGTYSAQQTALAEAVSSIMQYVCILNYNTGTSGAQYSLATTKGAIPGSANAFPAPGNLDLSPTGGVNVAPSTFGAWYPSGYDATPTNPT